MALWRRSDRELATRGRRARLFRLVGPSGLCARRTNGQARMELLDRRPGEGRCRAGRADTSTPVPMTGPLCARRAERRPSVAGRRRPARRSLRDAVGRSRASFRQLHERTRVRLLTLRKPALVGAKRELRLFPRGARGCDRVRRFLRPGFTRSRREPAERGGRTTPARRSRGPRRSSAASSTSRPAGRARATSPTRARRTFALDAATGRLVWRSPMGSTAR